ncbi:MAG: hypothetical protein KF708_06600 [Pirellulales bacterium]|nr:hypothetical protein [Pirellulales bacterium]
MRASKQLRAIALKVAEVDDMLESLNATRVLKDLSGRQRQQLEDVHGSLEMARRAAHGGVVYLPIEVVVEILRCAAMTQRWLGELTRDLFVEDGNE